MKRAMIITVGVGKDVEHAIVFSIRHHNPDLLAFCYSEDSKTKVEEVRKHIDYNDQEIILNYNPEINHFEKLHLFYCQCIKSIEQKGFSKSEIVADYTSGTKAMSAALVSAAITQQIDLISYVYGERGLDGRVQTGTEIIYSLPPRLVYTEQYLSLSRQFFNQYQFEACITILESNKIHPSKQKEAQWILNLAKMYDAWDKFKFKDAMQFHQLLDPEISKDHKAKDKLEKYAFELRQLQEQLDIYNKAILKRATEEEIERIGFTLTYDLANNAQRRCEEGKFDDAVARLYRALETVAQFNYLKATKKVTEIGVDSTMKLLAELDDETGKNYLEKEQDWKKNLFARNNSILAHGFLPVSKDQYEKFYAAIVTLLPGFKEKKWVKL